MNAGPDFLVAVRWSCCPNSSNGARLVIITRLIRFELESMTSW